MHPPSEALSDTERFNSEIGNCFPCIDLNTIYHYDESDIRLQISHHTTKEKGNLAGANIQHAVKQSSQLNARRKKRNFILRGGHNTETLAASMIEFLDSFSTIGEILKAIDPRAGGIAYGTLYILFKVCILQRKGAWI